MAQREAGELWHSERRVSYGTGIDGRVMAQGYTSELWHSDRWVSYGTDMGNTYKKNTFRPTALYDVTKVLCK